MIRPESTGTPAAIAGTDIGLNGVVGIGASAGGLQALEDFFRAVQPGRGMAYVVVQHLSPDFKSLMEDLLARHTTLPIHRVSDGMRLEADTIYLIPPRSVMRVHERTLRLEQRDGQATDLPIDVFFVSLARSWGSKAVAIVLSGTGSDGSKGLIPIASCGGLVLAQDPVTAEFPGMPQAAIDTDQVRQSAAPADLARLTYELFDQPLDSQSDRQADLSADASPLERIMLLLQDQAGIDFSVYKTNTIERRIARRMGLRQIAGMADYLSLLAGDPEEVSRLLSDLLIGVTSFFRDENTFRMLRTEVLPELIARFRDVEEFRVWVAGCATGEEAYSIAMLLHEAAQHGHLTGRIRIFASDVHKPAIELASSGIYAQDDVAAIPPELAERYIVPISTRSVRIAQGIRDLVVFAPHNLLVDPPFTRLHLVTCRNLLIYLEQEAQVQALNTFGYCLRTGGILQLGSSEGLGSADAYFDTVDPGSKIYRKARTGPMPQIGHRRRRRAASSVARRPIEESPQSLTEHRLLHDYDLILRQTQLCGFLIDERRRLLHVFGDAGQYLSMPSGRVSDDLARMLPEELATAIASLSQRASMSMEVHSIQGLHLQSEAGHSLLVDLTASPLPGRAGRSAHVLLSLRNRRTTANLPARAEDERLEMSLEQAYRQRIDDLELELNTTRENLQATIEELQTSNEELQSTNEELQSSNEELQSSNEELHSVNEELYTVNAEYENKNRILSELNRDHSALLDSVDVAIIFLDARGVLRRFNAAATDFFRLTQHDQGRPILHIGGIGNCTEDLEADLGSCLGECRALTRELHDENGRSVLRRLLPVRTGDQSVEGLLLTLTDITDIRATQADLRHSEEHVASLLEVMEQAVFEVDPDLRIMLCNRAGARLLEQEREELLGTSLDGHLYLRDEVGEPISLAYALRACATVQLDRRGEERRWLHLRSNQVAETQHQVVTLTDITESRLRTDVFHHNLRLDSLGRLVGGIAHDFNNILTSMLGFTQLLRKRLEGDDGRNLRLVDQIATATERATDLTRRMLSFGRKREFALTRVDVADEIATAIDLLGNHASQHRVGIERQSQLARGPVRADPTLLQMALVNLGFNAIEAMPEGGTLRLDARLLTIDSDLAARCSPPIRTGDYIQVAVSDTGRGILPEHLPHILEPFFTTKEAEDGKARRGSGLGLAAVHGSMAQFGGGLLIESAPDQGTTVYCYLPLDSSADATHRLRVLPAEVPAPNSGTPCCRQQEIVLADDEDSLRELLAEILGDHGHTVQAHANGRDLVEALQNGQPCQIVLLDMIMPIMNGADAAEAIARLPDPPRVILMTGHAGDADIKPLLEQGLVAEVLYKPFRDEELLAAICRNCPLTGCGQ